MMERAESRKVAPSPSKPSAASISPAVATPAATTTTVTTPINHANNLAKALLLCMILWAFAVPIKNVALIIFPDIRQDSVETKHSAYAYTSATAATGPVVIRGEDILPLLRRVADLALANAAVFDSLNSAATFDIDAIHDYLSIDEFHSLSLYYALLFQASELPGFALTPRPRVTVADWETDTPTSVRLYVRPEGETTSTKDVLLKVSCLPENARLQGALCWLPGTKRRCNDFFDSSVKLDFMPVDLDPFRANGTASGLTNNAGLLTLVTAFHTQMVSLFGLKRWRTVIFNAGMDASVDDPIKHSMATVFRDDVPVISSAFMALIGLDGTRNTTYIESCVAAELTVSTYYTTAAVMSIIQDALRAADVYNPYELNYSKPANTMAMLAPMLAFNVSITTGARPIQVHKKATQIFYHDLTTVTSAAMSFKLDKDFSTAVDALGSSVRMLQYLSFYPNIYSQRSHSVGYLTAANGSLVPYDKNELRIIGSLFSGYNTFKPDSWWQCTMMVYRLSEVPLDVAANGTVQDPWWDDEAQYAAWFAALEKSADAPLLLLNNYFTIYTPGNLVVLKDVLETRCHRAFYKVLTKVAWLAMNSVSGLPEYLVFQSAAENGGKDYFLKQVRTLQLVGEGITGKRLSFPYTIDSTDRLDDGSAWVSLFILDALVATQGKTATLTAFLTTYRETFGKFIVKENTEIHFPDTGHCIVTPLPAYTNASVTDLTDPLRYEQGVMAFMDVFLDRVPALLARLKADLAPLKLASADVPHEVILGNGDYDRMIRYTGSPVSWHATPLMVGLLKLMPAYTPPARVVREYRNATRCYRTLELKYLNASTRCFTEPGNHEKTRIEYNATMLRTLLFSTWAISLVLNLTATLIAFQYARKLVWAYTATRFVDVDFVIASGLSFATSGILSLDQTFQMALSTVPLIITYHLPADEVFMPTLGTTQWPKLIKDAIVASSMMWFLKLASDLTNMCMRLRVASLWFNSVWLRVAGVFVVFLARAGSADNVDGQVNYPWWRLVATLMGAVVLGIVSALVPLVLERRYLAGKRSLSRSEVEMERNPVIKTLQKRKAPLNEYGVLGYSPSGAYWAVTGLLVEGWEIIEDEKKAEATSLCLRKHRHIIPLQVDSQGNPICKIQRPKSQRTKLSKKSTAQINQLRAARAPSSTTAIGSF